MDRAALLFWPDTCSSHNETIEEDEERSVIFGCSRAPYFKELIGSGSYEALNKSIVDVAESNDTKTILTNGTLPNGTALAGDEDINSASARWVVGTFGYWPTVAVIEKKAGLERLERGSHNGTALAAIMDRPYEDDVPVGCKLLESQPYQGEHQDTCSNMALEEEESNIYVASGYVPEDDEFHFETWSDTDSCSGGSITKYDWRLAVVKTRLYTSHINVTQYWTWVSQTQCFQHQILKDVEPGKWGLFRDEIDFHVKLAEIEVMERSIEALRVHIIMKMDAGAIVADGKPRGDVMASFRRARTMRRFLFFCRERGMKMAKGEPEQLNNMWDSMVSERLLGRGDSHQVLVERVSSTVNSNGLYRKK
ncbi:hypothetical protein FOPG_18443 [Fusarium oxysporum f. sp. conglutinans race 2 54008]|uniref:DUF7732 domain-containing protein n=1 Tax=Fusarium oxysporum f. sp. conglutinans race 2 54008 TaxID=1089457 RepID=X0GP13_FUSOX|nr:hypothetical protein FOPG_18443 [Fusarium oxysporum f. sp. conglutinans race 2 54008]